MFAHLGRDLARAVNLQPAEFAGEHLVLEERLRHTCCGRSRTQRLRGTTVPVQDRTGMEICNANGACATHGYLYLG